jgi:hypothetical protein
LYFTVAVFASASKALKVAKLEQLAASAWLATSVALKQIATKASTGIPNRMVRLLIECLVE